MRVRTSEHSNYSIHTRDTQASHTGIGTLRNRQSSTANIQSNGLGYRDTLCYNIDNRILQSHDLPGVVVNRASRIGVSRILYYSISPPDALTRNTRNPRELSQTRGFRNSGIGECNGLGNHLSDAIIRLGESVTRRVHTWVTGTGRRYFFQSEYRSYLTRKSGLAERVTETHQRRQFS